MFRRINAMLVVFLCLIAFASCYNGDVNYENETGNNEEEGSSTGVTTEVKVTDSKLEDTPSEVADNKTKDIPNIKIRYFNPPISQFMTWPDIYGTKVVFANWAVENSEVRNIYVVDIETYEIEKIYTAKEDYPIIDDVRIGSEWIFWIEGDISLTKWRIMAYNLLSKELKTLRESGIEQGATLFPRLDNDDNTVVWLEGIEDESNNLLHYIYTYDFNEDRIVQVAKVNYVDNPYQITRIRNNIITFPDLIDGHWAIKMIDLSTNKEIRIDCLDQPVMPSSDGNIVAWVENDIQYKRNLYIYDLKTEKKKFVDSRIFLMDVHEGNVLYTKSLEGHHLYKYYTQLDEIVCLTENEKKEHIYFDFFNAYENITVCVYDGQLPASLVIIEELTD